MNSTSLKQQTDRSFYQGSSKGFSLIEVLIAMTIMTTSTLLLYTAWSGNQIRVQKMSINNKAAYLLDQIINELEIEYMEKFSQLPEEDGDAFKDHPNFTWKMESKDFEMPDLRSILISGKEGDEMLLTIIDKLTDHLNESVKEMKVTVIYKKGKRKVKYSATTFLVDYNKSIPMGGAAGVGGQ